MTPAFALALASLANHSEHIAFSKLGKWLWRISWKTIGRSMRVAFLTKNLCVTCNISTIPAPVVDFKICCAIAARHLVASFAFQLAKE